MPIIHISRNPLNNINDTEQHHIAPGSDVAGFVQATPDLQGVMLIAVVNGQPCMRTDWCNALHDNDVVLLIVRPRGGGGSNPLRVLASLAVLAFAGWAVGAMGLTGLTANLVRAGIVMLGNTLVNQLMPLPQQPESRQLPEPSPTYSLRGQSNIARIGQPITLHYGRHIVWPDLVMSPYYEYDGDDQWYHTLMCVGLGHIEVTDIKFGDVALLSLDSGDYGVQVIYPGQGVTLLPATVYTASVSGAELSSAWSASGYSNPPGSSVGKIGVDVAFNGLVKIDRNGNMQDHTVTVEVRVRPVNDVNASLGGWTTILTEAVTDNTVDAVRRTIKASVSGGRYEVQARVTADPINGQDNDKNTFRDVCVWGGLRGYGGTHPAYGDCTLLAVKVKANELLSQQSTQQISCLGHRHLKHWTTAGGWSGLQASRSIVWAMADAYLNANNGNQPENTLLLTELETLHTRLETLNNHFDYRFDETGAKLLPTLNMIVRAGRSSVIHHIGRWRLIRDEPKTVPVQMFTADNMTGFNVSLSAPQDYDPDALIGTFIDADTWQQATLTYSDVSEPIRAETIDLPGITSRQHAWAELAYMVKAEKRRERGSFTTGMEGRIPVPHDLIAVCPEGIDWGHWGHIVAKTGSKLSLSNALPFTSGKIMLRNSVGGSLGVFAITVTNDTEATATGLPAFNLPDIHREPVYYIAGETESSIILCKVTDLTPQQNDQVQISFVVEDSGVYLAPGAVPEDEVPAVGGGGVNLAVPWLKSSGVSTTEGVCTLTFAWGAAPSAELYEADYRVNDTAWAQAALSGQLSYALQATPSQIIQFRVRAKAAGGIGAYQSLSITACGAATAVAPDPGQLALESPFIGPVLKVAWSLTAGVSAYKLRIYDTATMTLRREVETTASRYDYSYLDAIADGGTHRKMTLRLHTTRNGVVSDVYSQLAVSNPQVAALTGLQVVGFNAQVGVLYTAPTVSDWAGILIYMSETANFTPSAANLVYDGIEPVIGLRTATAAPYYVRVAAYDFWGRDSLNLSAQYSGKAILFDPTEHEEIMAEHAQIMAEHAQRMAGHELEMAEHKQVMITHAAELAEHAQVMTGHDIEMAEHGQVMLNHAAELAEHARVMVKHAQIMAGHTQTMTDHDIEMAEHGQVMAIHKAELAEHEQVMANHTQIMAEHGRTMTQHAVDLANHDVIMADHSTVMAEHDNRISSLDGEMSAANQALAVNATEISNAKAILATTNQTLASTKTALANVQTDLASANTAISANANAIAAANLELDTVPAKITNTIAAGVSATYITGQITATQITDGAINTPKLAAGSVIAGKIAAGAVEAGSIAAGAVIAGKIAANAVTATNLAALSINAGHIVADAITAEKIAANAVTANELAANSVVAGKIATYAITADKIAANAITADKIAALSINAGHIVSGSITGDKVSAKTLHGNTMIAGTLHGDLITAGTLHGHAIITNTLDGKVITTDTLDGKAIKTNTLNGKVVIANSLHGDAITFGTLDGTKIRANSIHGDLITFGTLNGATLKANSIHGDAIKADTVNGDVIIAGSLHGDAITFGTLDGTKIRAGSIHGDLITFGTLDGAIIRADSIHGDAITFGTLDGAKIRAGSIHGKAITFGTLDGATIKANSIHGDAITADTVDGDVIKADSLHGDAITAFTLHGDAITFGTLAGAALKAKTIYSDKLFVSDLSAISANMGTITAGKIQSPSGLISVDMAAQYSNPVIRINKEGTYDAAFWVTADGQVRLSGALEVRSPESNSQMRAVATHGYSSALISNGRYPDTGNGVQFHAPNTHSSATIRQRVRSYYTTYQTLPIVVTATAVVDHYFSLWYWIEGTSTDWTYLTGTYDPVGGDGSVTLTQVIELVPSSGRILITASSSDSNRNCYDSGKQWMKNYSISAMVVNI